MLTATGNSLEKNDADIGTLYNSKLCPAVYSDNHFASSGCQHEGHMRYT